MATTTSSSTSLGFIETSVGKKALMAVSGVILLGFVIAHMAGNLQIYQGPEALNSYAHWLRTIPKALWTMRAIVLFAVLVHIVAAYQLTVQSRRGRGSRYVKFKPQAASYASRTMRWSGVIIVAFVIYHLLDLTFGVANPDFNHELDVYHNVVASFSQPLVAGAYVVANALLGMHLVHGVWSMFQTVGLNNGHWTRRLRLVAAGATAVIVVGNISMPVAVLAGIIR